METTIKIREKKPHTMYLPNGLEQFCGVCNLYSNGTVVILWKGDMPLYELKNALEIMLLETSLKIKKKEAEKQDTAGT